MVSLVLKLLVTAAVAIFGQTLYLFASNYLRSYTSPISVLPGPKRASLLRGNFGTTPEPDNIRTIQSWIGKYGTAIRYFTQLGNQKLCILDTKAIQHILAHGSLYQKSDQLRHHLGSIVGQGLLFVEGEDHKRQRKVVNPAFGPAQVRRFTETFMLKSLELRDVWASLASQSTRKDGRVRVDGFTWLNKVTLDIIGLTGFAYDFDALHADDSRPNELFEAINKAFANPRGLFAFLSHVSPLVRSLPNPYSHLRQKNLDVINSVGTRMIQEKKAAVLSSKVNGHIEKDDISGHDLLSLLIRSNLASDMPQSMRLSDEEILAQVPTFLIAGHETTSTLLMWTLFALCTSLEVQQLLRAEVRAHYSETPILEELNSLPYLDAVIRETLRLYAPVSQTVREVTSDDVIPLSEPTRDKYGREIGEIKVTKGDVVNIPIRLLNRAVFIWGEDAEEFRPERFLAPLPDKVAGMPGIYPQLLSFLAGPHACIGFRFALAEAKAILFTMVRNFEFELAVAPDEIVRKSHIVGRPFINGQESARGQLPLLIRPIKD
ncbi:cytochrome P450 [Peniophora sp. CONT]|nr:cytochrome P450 [Peniophora sp. CONT]